MRRRPVEGSAADDTQRLSWNTRTPNAVLGPLGDVLGRFQSLPSASERR